MKFNQVTNSGEKKITRGYGMKMHPIHKRMKMHHGIDIPVSTGHDIYAIADGVIIDSEIRSDACGGTIKVSHGVVNGKKLYTRFCHCSKLLKKKGDIVKQGDVIAKSGGGKGDPGRGGSTGSHIHFEVYENGNTVDPMPYYKNSVGGEQTELPSEVDLDKYKDELEKDGEVANGSDGKSPKENARQIAKSLLLKLFGADGSSTVTPDVVNEVLRYKEIISEQTPTFITPTLTSSTETNTTTCGPYDSPIEACKSRTESNGGINWLSSNPQAKIHTQTDGKIEAITNKGNWNNAVKIGNKEYFWNGTMIKTVGNGIGNREQIGTGDKLFIRSVSGSNQTPPKQSDGKVTNQTKQPTANSTDQNKYQDSAKNMVKGVISKLMGAGETQAPQTNMESIEKLKNTISEEIKMFNKLIK